MTMQVENLEKFLSWVKSCPCTYTVLGMHGGFVNVKFKIPPESAISDIAKPGESYGGTVE